MPYIDNEKELTDPWNQPYRYDSSLTYHGVNQFTGSTKPAIWSAGPDKTDGTDDDIRSWDIVEAQERLQQRMQMQIQGGGMGMGQDMMTMEPTSILSPGTMPIPPGSSTMPIPPGSNTMPIPPGPGTMPPTPTGM
jgi:hypothetical protein